jgi:hypothetical protein
MNTFDLYRIAGDAIAEAWNSGAGPGRQLPPIDLSGNERLYLGKAAVDAISIAASSLTDRTGFDTGAINRATPTGWVRP